METAHITRDTIVRALIASLEPLDFVYALWEGGAASFNRIDRWSDIDLYVVCEDERVEDTLEASKDALGSLSPIALTYRVAEPTWHGHAQVFYRLRDASKFLFVDAVVMKKTSKDKFLQHEIHGKPLVHFDKIAVVKDESVDAQDFLEKIEARLEVLKTRFELFQVLVLKELNRGNDIESMSYYMACTYRPLVEALRIKHCPYHYDFHTSYIYYDLPQEVVEHLHKLCFLGGAEDIRGCRIEAEKWFWETVSSVNRADLIRMLTASG